jgi:putative two-component system response regulator
MPQRARMNSVKTQVQRKALVLEKFTVDDIVRATGLNPESVRTELQRMRREGLLSSRRQSTDMRRHGGQPYTYYLTSDPETRLGLLESLEDFYPVASNSSQPISTYYVTVQQRLDQAEAVEGAQRHELLAQAEIALDVAEEAEGGSSAPILVKAYLQFEETRLHYLQGRYAEAKGKIELLIDLFTGVDEEMVKRIRLLQSTLENTHETQKTYNFILEDNAVEIQHLDSSRKYRSLQLTLLNRIGRIITSSLDTKYVPSLILQEIADLLLVKDCSLLLLDDKRDELVFVANTGNYRLIGRRLPRNVGLAGHVAETGISEIVSNVQQDVRFNHSIDKEIGYTTDSLMAVALRNVGGIRGIIEVVNPPESDQFTLSDLSLLELGANQMLIALQHIWGSADTTDIISILEEVTRPVQFHEWLDDTKPLDLFEIDTDAIPTILVVDDELAITTVLARILINKGYRVKTASTGRDALSIARKDLPDLILLDVRLPDIDGLTVCRLLKEDERTTFIPIMMVTAIDEKDVRERALEAGADDFVQKPFEQNILKVHVDTQLRLKRLYNQLSQTEDVIFTLAQIVETKDAATEGHQLRVSTYSEQLALACGLKNGRVRAIRYAALLHDIGKIGISEAILRKAGGLTLAEREQMQQHAEIGARIVEPMRLGREVAQIVRAHHEFWNGSGYPYGLREEQIPIGARIIAIANAFDSMTTDRPFRVARPPEQAIWELRDYSGVQFDPKVVEIFIDLILNKQLIAFGSTRQLGE